MVHFEQQRSPRLERALLQRAKMHEQIAGLLLGIGHAKPRTFAAHHAAIADLAAGLGVKRRLIENDRSGFAWFVAFYLVAVFAQRRNDPFGALGLVTEKFGGAELLA